jgi:hypothetical protein
MLKTDSKPVSEEELKRRSDIESIELKDGAGYGDLQSLPVDPDKNNRDSETYVGKPAPPIEPMDIKRSETYIHERKSYSMGMTDQNKLKNTKLGDHINYYENGVSGAGVVIKMSGQFIQIFKDDGKYYNININDTFHVADILINKTWNDMSMEERTDELMKIKAYSPRFLSKTWDQLPRELKDVMKIQANRGVGAFGGSDLPQGDKTPATATAGTKFFDQNGKQHATKEEADAVGQKTGRNLRTERATRDAYNADTRQTIGQRTNVNQSKISKAEWDAMKSSIEDGAFGNAGNSPTTGVSTKIPFDAPKDYEGQTHDSDPKQFKYEDDKPEVGSEVKAPEVQLDEQGLIKTGEFVYSDNPQGYKLPPKPTTKGYGMRYGVKYINQEEDN